VADLLVLLCDLPERELGEDVLARLGVPRVLPLEPWDAVRSLFGVQRLDAAFEKQDSWIATALLAHVPAEAAISMAVGTTLTREVAFNAMAHQLLGAKNTSVDAILNAAADLHPFVRLDELTDEARTGLLAAIARDGGPLGGLVAAILEAGRGADLLALGLAARAVYGPDGELEGGKAAGKLEALCANHVITPAAGAALAERCEETVRTLLMNDLDRANAVVARAEGLAEELQALNPEGSALLPTGFIRRITMAVVAIQLVVSSVDEGASASESALETSLAELRSALSRVAEHAESRTPAGRRRAGHLYMAARLATWLVSSTAESNVGRAVSFEEAASAYAASSAWVDRARHQLWRGDDDADVALVYRGLLDRVVVRRRAENQRFAELLASWTIMPSTSEALAGFGLTTVESVVGRVLTAFGDMPVLLVVLDGCGLPSFSELAPQFSQAGFREIVFAGSGGNGGGPERRLTAIAALPTVTEVSRASLIAGHLTQGNQDQERKDFADNAAIRRDGQAAVFFHQNRLLGAAGASLSPEVYKALGPNGPAVVGVVINTIDDQLRKGTFAEELRLSDLHALVSLLDAARNQGRVVVVSADHGHVLAQPPDGGSGTFGGQGGDGGERWREADRAPKDTEVLLDGDRVLLGGSNGILAPWEDDYRYSAKAGGYHGGATPEEVLVPVAAYLPAGISEPPGWGSFNEAPPLWWDLLTKVVQIPVAVIPESGRARKGKSKVKPVDQAQPPMFELETPSSGTVGAPVTAGTRAWVDALLASEVWKNQVGQGGRAPLPDDRVRSVLGSIVGRGNIISFAALAADTSIPQARLAGFLANLSLLLNVDGYVVLDVNASVQEAKLVPGLLAQQFQITVGNL
jgi:hypothetical protein